MQHINYKLAAALQLFFYLPHHPSLTYRAKVGKTITDAAPQQRQLNPNSNSISRASLALFIHFVWSPHMKNSSNSAHRRAPPHPPLLCASASLKHEFQLLLVPHVEHAPNAKVTERRHCSLALVSTPLDASKCCIFLAAAAPFSL